MTGRMDLWEPADPREKVDLMTWDYDKHATLQDKKMDAFIRKGAGHSRSSARRGLIVTSIAADDYGGATVCLSGGYRLVLFPAGTSGEDSHYSSPEPRESISSLKAARSTESRRPHRTLALPARDCSCRVQTELCFAEDGRPGYSFNPHSAIRNPQLIGSNCRFSVDLPLQ